MAQAAVCDRFKAPEGEYTLYTNKGKRFQFSTTRAPRLTLAEVAVPAGSDSGATTTQQELLVLTNIQDFFHVYQYSRPDQEPLRSVYCGSSTTHQASACCSHAWAPSSSDGIDTIIGLTTGDVLATSLAGQLASQRGDTAHAACLHFNSDGSDGSGRVIGVAWLAKDTIAAALSSGTINMYDKISDSSAVSQTHLKSIVSLLGRPSRAALQVGCPVAAITSSPEGALLAAACADGCLRIWDALSLQLVAGFKSFFGGLCCVAWSPCGGFVTAGGEDDLVTLYSLDHRSVVGWGRGHTSWVSAVAFDPHMDSAGPGSNRETRVLRVVSGGQDCQLGLWDFEVPAEAAASTTPALLVRLNGTAAACSSGSSGGGSSQGIRRLRDGDGGSSSEDDVIAACVPHAEMVFVSPVRMRRVMLEPISSVLPTPDAIFTASFSGQQRVWKRPRPRDARESRDAPEARDAHVPRRPRPQDSQERAADAAPAS